jgi:anti-sigma28 factor (negative regulator of flagellin synthesis)
MKRRSRQQFRAFRREAWRRGQRLVRLQSRIERGVYLVSAGRIAAAMLNEGADCGWSAR